jgi:methylated-DNA-[protein]-cysteine S-methyltransferase
MSSTLRRTIFGSPLGPLLLVSDGSALRALHFSRARSPADPADALDAGDGLLVEARGQVEEYLRGERRLFDLPLALGGTPFQRRVWEELGRIPFGETVSYRQIAERIGTPGAVRAVGLANGANPVAIIVPCHRVIGSDGRLTGYGGGLPNKRWLLDHEARVAGRAPRALAAQPELQGFGESRARAQGRG